MAEPLQVLFQKLEQRDFVVYQENSCGSHAYQMASGLSPGLNAKPRLSRWESF